MIEVFEGPLCCNTGVCGTGPQQALVDFTADAKWAQSHGATVRRANLAQDPLAFAQSEIARAFVKAAGSDALPLVVADGVTVLTGRYPTRTELARFASIEAPVGVASTVEDSASCCGGDAPADCCSTPATTPKPDENGACCGNDNAGADCCSTPESTPQPLVLEGLSN